MSINKDSKDAKDTQAMIQIQSISKWYGEFKTKTSDKEEAENKQ